MRGSSLQVKEGTVEEKMHTVRSVTTEWATTAWEVTDVAALEKKTLKNSRVRSITANTADASVHADICHYFVVSWNSFQERDAGCDARDL
jgi:ATP-dependent helicase YprA (DUF1998 family)